MKKFFENDEEEAGFKAIAVALAAHAILSGMPDLGPKSVFDKAEQHADEFMKRLKKWSPT